MLPGKTILRICLLIFFQIGSSPGLGQAITNTQSDEHRVALVIGNASYLSGPLNNTVNDARAMAIALESAGFQVLLHENVRNQNDMKKVVREFGMKLKTGGTALFYYAGHGMQVDGFNYLIPTQAVMNIQQEIEYEALDVGFVLAYMESASSDVNLVILDACRNNPFARSFRDTRQGLSSMVAPAGTLIAYSTAPGSIASDGDEDYGLYTRALLEKMQQPGVKVEDVFKNVRAEVLEVSQGKQTPWESSSLVGDFYFHGPGQAQAQVQHALPVNQPDIQDEIASPAESSSGTINLQTMQRTNTEQQVHQGTNSIIPRGALKTSGIKISFRWKATPDGQYFLWCEDREISKETVFEARKPHLYVYHESTNRVFRLRNFFYNLDGTWHRGVTYD